jgi:NAD(P)-dependent dehydrogenase (short-subunit alcohol dehydrogenase family)
MELKNKVAVVTGGANGIGRALCRKFAAEGARGVVVADLDADGAARVAAEIGGLAVPTDVSVESDIFKLVEKANARFTQIDLFCSNAGVVVDGGVEVSNSNWQLSIGVNLMAHIYAARAVLPAMLARGEGYLLQTVSAAGLLTSIASASYAATKHAALAFAEWLSITYGDAGIKVSALCPQGVRTNMLPTFLAGDGEYLRESALEPEQVAEIVVASLAKEQFLILPQAQVAELFQRKANEYDRWIRGMRRLREKVHPRVPGKA